METMSLKNEIEDSLQVCQEIEKKLTYGENPVGSLPGEEGASAPQQIKDEINGILSRYQEPEPEPERMEEPVIEPELSEEPVSVPERPVESEPEPESTAAVPEEPVFDTDMGNEKLPEKTAGQTAAERHPVLKTLLSVLVCIFSALVLTLLITNYVAHHTSVEGSSMEASLSDGDQIIVENVSYYLHSPERFDVIVFPNKDGVSYIKRIIGLPGEAVWIFDGQIYINGELLIEDYGNEPLEDPGLAAGEIQLGEDEYFVLGDNRNASIDSRQVDVGTIHRKDIKGKAWLRFFPFKKIGTIN